MPGHPLILAGLDLRPVDRATAELATALASLYRLKAADATQLATAVGLGAARFIASNRRDCHFLNIILIRLKFEYVAWNARKCQR